MQGILILLAGLTMLFPVREVPRSPGKLHEIHHATDVVRGSDTLPQSDTIPEAGFLHLPDTLPQERFLFPNMGLTEAESSLLPDRSVLRDTLVIKMTLILPDTLIIIGTGDIMPGTNYPDDRYLPPGNDCSRLFDPVREVLQSADLTFGNLEGVFASSGGVAKRCSNPETCFVFRMPDEYLDCILDAGYDLLSVANNHINDFGAGGRAATKKLLEEKEVPFAGLHEKPSVIFRHDSLLIGFAAFSPHRGTAPLKDYTGAARIVKALDDTCDIVIVSFHGGAEGRDHQHVPCTDEIYLGYNRGNVCTFARAVVDAGADVVFGHGPHVIRAMELYRDRLICYSLGNFCTYARFNLSGPNGIAPIVKVRMTTGGRFIDGEIIPVHQPGAGGPRIDPLGRAISKLRTLNEADFPGSQLELTPEGKLTRKKDLKK